MGYEIFSGAFLVDLDGFVRYILVNYFCVLLLGHETKASRLYVECICGSIRKRYTVKEDREKYKGEVTYKGIYKRWYVGEVYKRERVEGI